MAMTAYKHPEEQKRFGQLLSAIIDRDRRPQKRDADMILLGAVLENALREAIHNEKKHVSTIQNQKGVLYLQKI